MKPYPKSSFFYVVFTSSCEFDRKLGSNTITSTDWSKLISDPAPGPTGYQLIVD